MFDPVRICEILNDERVDYVIVGGFADGLSVRIAALDDIIDSKRTANRPKDVMALPYLESLRDQQQRRSKTSTTEGSIVHDPPSPPDLPGNEAHPLDVSSRQHSARVSCRVEQTDSFDVRFANSARSSVSTCLTWVECELSVLFLRLPTRCSTGA
jgi:hypothetical protein